MNATPQNILQGYLEDHKNTWIQTICDLVKIESPSADGEGCRRVLAYVQERLAAAGYKTHLAGDRQAPILTMLPREKSYQLLVGHVDTVWPRGQIQVQPLRVTDSVITGPGVFDMKAGIANALLVLEALAHLDIQPARPIAWLLNSDEETGSAHSREAVAECAANASCVWVMEPALDEDGALKTARRGVMRFQVDVQGMAAHSGMDPEKGVNAIRALAQRMIEIQALAQPHHGFHINLGTVSGGQAANIVAPHAQALIEARFRDPQQRELLIQHLNRCAENGGPAPFSWQVKVEIPPMVGDAAQLEWVDLVLRCGSELGLELRTAMSGGASDANTTSQYAPTVDGLGAVGAGAHAVHEYILIEATFGRAILLAQVLCRSKL